MNTYVAAGYIILAIAILIISPVVAVILAIVAAVMFLKAFTEEIDIDE